MNSNSLYYGDNLDILRRYLPDKSVDLIYLDPPFKSNQTYNVLFQEKDGSQSASQIKAFEDTWHWDEQAAKSFEDAVEAGGQAAEAMRAFRQLLGSNDMLAYLSMMAPRLVELRRVLKDKGSLYLHCDPVASHFLKLLLDAIFGHQNFRSEIIWRRTNAHNKISRQYGPIHDTILFYTATDKFTFHPGRTPYTKAYIEDRFKYEDQRGRYQTNYLTGPGIRKGNSGKEWGGFDPTNAGRHWAIPRSLRKFLPDDGHYMSSRAALNELDTQDLIVFPKKSGGQPMYKQYIGDGTPYQDIWAYQPNTQGVLYGTDDCIDRDVKYLEHEEEKLSYPTQKPVGLLGRIIRTGSDEGATVLDPFCGCGTTIAAAQKLGRRWIGIDITHLAISLIRHRLRDSFGEDHRLEVIGEPTSLQDAATLGGEDPYQFQWWALGLAGARPAEQKKGADRGIDGRLYFHDEGRGGKTKQIIFSVKAGHVTVSHIRDLVGVINREKAQIGAFLSLDPPTSPMRKEAASAGFYESPWGKHPRIQLLTIEALLGGKSVDYPQGADVTFKKAQRVRYESPNKQQELPMEGEPSEDRNSD